MHVLEVNRTLFRRFFTVSAAACCLWTGLKSTYARFLIHSINSFAVLCGNTSPVTFLVIVTIIPGLPLWGLVALATLINFAAWRNWLPEPYGLYHVELNEGSKEWGNMGYWKDANTFEDACEALALLVINASNCRPGGRVLDVGFGTGDSLLLHLSHPSVPRPAELMGITSVPAQHSRAQSRTSKALSSSSAPVPLLSLHCGDAIFRTPITKSAAPSSRQEAALAHPLQQDPSSVPLDSITCIDCAYHFDTRILFLRQSFQALAEGGTVALADIAFEPFGTAGVLKFLLREALAVAMSVPSSNLVPPSQYVSQLQEIGFSSVRVHDITPYVFPAFAAFLSTRPQWQWRVFAPMISFWQWSGARYLLVSAIKKKSVA